MLSKLAKMQMKSSHHCEKQALYSSGSQTYAACAGGRQSTEVLPPQQLPSSPD